jgi:hypothetical protein
VNSPGPRTRPRRREQNPPFVKGGTNPDRHRRRVAQQKPRASGWGFHPVKPNFSPRQPRPPRNRTQSAMSCMRRALRPGRSRFRRCHRSDPAGGLAPDRMSPRRRSTRPGPDGSPAERSSGPAAARPAHPGRVGAGRGEAVGSDGRRAGRTRPGTQGRRLESVPGPFELPSRVGGPESPCIAV